MPVIYFNKLPNRSNKVHNYEFSAVDLALNLCKIQDAADIIRKPPNILNHIFKILELIISGKFVFDECFQIEI